MPFGLGVGAQRAYDKPHQARSEQARVLGEGTKLMLERMQVSLSRSLMMLCFVFAYQSIILCD